MLIPRKYRLEDGSLYWHKLYYAMVPKWMTKYGPPLGHFNYAATLCRPQEYLANLYREGKWFLQRGYRGYSDRDAWSIDTFLTQIMPPMLEQLDRGRLSYPAKMTPEIWGEKLEDMIDGFIAGRELQELKYGHKSKGEREALKRFHYGMKLFHTYFFSLWD